jgi:hypothetical protein
MPKNKEKSFADTVSEVWNGKPRTRDIAVSKSTRAKQHIRKIKEK